MNYTTVLILILLLFFSCDKQENVRDRKKYDLKLRLLLEDFKESFKDKERTLVINNEILSLSEKYHDTFQMIVSINYIANTHFFLGHFDRAIEGYKKSLEFYISNPKLTDYEIQVLRESHLSKLRVLLSLGESYINIGEVAMALHCFEESSRIATKQNDRFYMLMSELYSCKLNEKIGKYELVTTDGLKVFNEFDKLKNEKHQFIVDLAKLRLATTISSAYLALNNVDSAVVILDRVRNLHHNVLNVQASLENSYGQVYLKQQEYDKALKKFAKARDKYIEYDSIYGAKAFAYNIARNHFYLNDFDLAIIELKNSLKSTKENDIFEKINTYKLFAKIYKAKGDLELSVKYYDKYVNLEKEVEQSKRLISDGFYSQKINILKSVNRKNIVIIFVFFSILIVLMFIFIGIRNKKNRRKFELLLSKLEGLEIESANSKNLDTHIKKHTIKETEVDRIITSLKVFIDKEHYLSMHCTLATTAKKLNTNTSYLSKVINTEYQKSFNTFLNELRINYALKRLKSDKMFRRYSILAIANELGYKSKESFNKIFRNRTGILPSYFIKQMEKTATSVRDCNARSVLD